MRVYRALLRLYPASFRVHYADELAAIFARRRRDAAGPAAVTALWSSAVADLLSNALRVHADVLGQDLRDARRSFARAPGFALTVVAVSALGIGATTAAFSITDHVLVRPLPFDGAERLVNVWQDQSFRGYSRIELSPGNFRDLRAGQSVFERMAAYTSVSGNLVGAGDPARLDGTSATADLFPMLGIEAALGRVLISADYAASAEPAVVLSDATWRLHLQADSRVLGRAITLNDTPHVIVGVMPPDFGFPDRTTDIWTPLRFAPDDYEDRSNTYLRVTAKLAPGRSIEQARAALGVIAAELERVYPEANARTGAAVVRLRDEISRQPRLLLLALAGAALSVLLIACINLANLLLARGLARRQELAVRAAIGAGRERLVRQALTESLLLAACGGALGIALAIAAAPLIARLVPSVLPISDVPAVDLRMLTLAALTTLVTGVAFGVAPALRVGRLAAVNALRDGARVGTGRTTERLRATLVLAEIALSVVLLVSSGLLIRALWRVQDVDPGFRTEGVLTLRTTLPRPEYEPTARRQQFYDRVIGEISAIPGVTDAAYISFLPMVMRGGIWAVAPGEAPPVIADAPTASLRFVTPGFFSVLQIRLLRGRDVADTDTQDSDYVAVVSESFADELWPDENALGQTFNIAFRARRIVGIVGDIRVRGLERASEPQVYLPSTQVPDGGLIAYAPQDLVVRSAIPMGSLVPAIRGIIRRADPRQPISSIRPLEDVVGLETAPRETQLWVLGAFAAVAFLLAAVGIHGLLAFAVSSQTREIGVRMALGARPGAMIRMVLRRGVLLAAGGVIVGGALAVAVGRAMQAILAGVSPADHWTFAAAIGLVLVMTVASSLLPAVRAARVDPMTAIRAE